MVLTGPATPGSQSILRWRHQARLAPVDSYCRHQRCHRDSHHAAFSRCGNAHARDSFGVSEDFAPVQRNAGILAGCGLNPERRYILVVGQYAPYKNHDGAIRAFTAACKAVDDIDLVLVQRQGPSSASLLKLARRLGMGDRIRFTGPVERAELIQLYSSAELLLHPSLCEGFGNPVIEAMACGCPVITSSISAMPEVACGAALLADPHDTNDLARQIREVLGDDGLAQDLRRRGHARAKEMRWERFAEANLAIYRRILGKQKAS